MKAPYNAKTNPRLPTTPSRAVHTKPIPRRQQRRSRLKYTGAMILPNVATPAKAEKARDQPRCRKPSDRSSAASVQTKNDTIASVVMKSRW